MEDNNPFKKIEPTGEEPREELRNVVMKRIALKEVMTDLLGLFSVKMGKSAKDLLDRKNPGAKV